MKHESLFKKVYKVIKLNQKPCLKPYNDINTDLRKASKNIFDKYFFKFMNNAVFRKTMKNVRKHRGNKLVTTETRRSYLVSEPNYHTTIFFPENL